MPHSTRQPFVLAIETPGQGSSGIAVEQLTVIEEEKTCWHEGTAVGLTGVETCTKQTNYFVKIGLLPHGHRANWLFPLFSSSIGDVVANRDQSFAKCPRRLHPRLGGETGALSSGSDEKPRWIVIALFSLFDYLFRH
jgi:hypothetical protein